MTSIVAVLNKHAVAIAADSAVTMGDTHKVLNSANKIFTLSKYHPVAVMIYGSASFMGVPWDIIIKEYRKQLKNDSFPQLRDYMLDFIKFIKSRNFFCEENAQHFYLCSVLRYFFKYCMDKAKNKNPSGKENVSPSCFLKIVQDFSAKFKNTDKCDDFWDYELKDFQKYAENDIEIIMKEFEIPSENRRFIEEVSLNLLEIKITNNINTGLVFVGYGEEEIYPSLVPINVSVVVDNRLNYYVDENRAWRISDTGVSSLIAPFAQVDVTQTIVRGINPAFQNIK